MAALNVVASRAATAAVAGVAGFASYRHIMKVASRAGETDAVSAVLPLAIDGLIVVATLAMVEDKRAGRAPRMSARIALVFGVAATLAANIASAYASWTARAVAAVPVVSFLLAVEVLARRGKRLPAAVHPDAAPAASGPSVRVDAAPVIPAQQSQPEPVGEPVAEPPARPRVSARSLSAGERVKAAHGRHPQATNARIAELAGVSVATVKRHRPAGSPTALRPAQTPDPAEPDQRVNGTAPLALVGQE